MLESLFNKVSGLLSLQLYQKETPTQVFFCEIYEIFKNIYFEEQLLMTASESFLKVVQLTSENYLLNTFKGFILISVLSFYVIIQQQGFGELNLKSQKSKAFPIQNHKYEMFLPSLLPKKFECYMSLILAHATPFMVHFCNKMAGHAGFV